MNLEFDGLWLTNFLSTGAVEQYIPFNEDLLTLVLGFSTDANGGETRNGTGKTTIIQALSYVLFGQALDRIKQDNLINNINGKKMLVATQFRRDGKLVRVMRGRKPNVLKLFQDGVEYDEADAERNGAMGENVDTQSVINNLLGFDHTMFCHILALNTNTVPFIKESAAKQREIMEKLLGATTLGDRAKVLSKLISESKRRVESEETKIEAIVEANRRINVAIDQAAQKKAEWDSDLNSRVVRVATELDAIESQNIDFDGELRIFDQIDTYDASLTAARSAKETAERELALNEREAKTLEGEVSTLLTLSQQDDPDGSIGKLTREIEAMRDQAVRDAQNARDASRRAAENANEVSRREKARAVEDCQSSIRQLEAALRDAEYTVDRLGREKDRETSLREAKMLEREAAHGSDCATCGQSLAGSDHLHKIEQNLDAQLAVIDEGIRVLEEKIIDARAKSDQYQASITSLRETEVAERKALDEHPAVAWEDTKLGPIEDTAEIISKLDALEVAKQAAIDLRTGILAEYEAQKAKVSDIRSAQSAYLADIDRASAALAELGSRPTSSFRSRDEVYRTRQAHEKKLDDLVRELEQTQQAVNPFIEQVESFRATLQIVSHDALHEAQHLLRHQDTLLKLLTQRDSFIRKRIIEQNLSNLNERMTHYLGKLGLPHEVQFLPDLSVEISLLGRDYDYDQMSRGEKTRIIMSTSWAFRDVWESLNHSVNLMWVDELLDNGLCASGSEAALGVLKTYGMGRNKNVFLISHREELRGRVEKTLMVKKENGFTEFAPDEI